MDETLLHYLTAMTGERSARAIALRAGIDPSTLTRQLNSALRPETVVEIARAYSAPVVPALVFVGLITQAEADAASVALALKAASDLELAKEMVSRVESGTATGQLTEPVELDEHANVVPFRQSSDQHDLMTVEIDDVPYAATDDDGGQPEFPNG